MDGAGWEFGHRTAAMCISEVFETLVGQLFARNPNQYEFYTKRVTLTVDNRKAILTIPLIQTPNNANGVLRCMPTGADCDCYPDETVFYPAALSAIKSTVDANNLSDFVFYAVTNNMVYFNKSLPKTITALLADVVPRFHGYDDDDFITFPAGIGQAIIDGSIAAMNANPAYINLYKKKK